MTACVLPHSTALPFSMTRISSAISATTAKSWLMNSTPIPLRVCSDFIRSNICACIVASRAVVGSSAINSLGSLISAIAIITRCRMPPENSNGYACIACSGSFRPTSSSSSIARVLACFFERSVCRSSGSVSCSPMRRNGFREVMGS